MNTLHLYAQKTYHDEAYIVGTREGLERLRDAIDAVLRHRIKIKLPTFTSDGEGYTIHIAGAEPDVIEDLMLPYTDEYIKGNYDHPSTLFQGDQP